MKEIINKLLNQGKTLTVVETKGLEGFYISESQNPNVETFKVKSGTTTSQRGVGLISKRNEINKEFTKDSLDKAKQMALVAAKVCNSDYGIGVCGNIVDKAYIGIYNKEKNEMYGTTVPFNSKDTIENKARILYTIKSGMLSLLNGALAKPKAPQKKKK